MTDRPNFFDLLELDPGETSWEVIRQRIDKKKEAWARDRTMGHPGKRLEAQRNSGLLPEIRRVLEDPALREREAEDARARRRKGRETELSEQIELFKATGTCRKEDFEKLVERFAGIFPEAELRSRLQAVGIRVEEAPKSAPPRERTPGDLARTIRRNLDVLHLNTLYEFLNLDPGSSPKDLCAKAESILKENRRSGKTTVEVTASNDLAGICKTLFSSAEEKRKYDTHWVLEVLEGLRDRLGLADRPLSQEELETLIRLAEQRGVPAGETRDFFASQIDPQRSAPQPAAPQNPSPREAPAGKDSAPGDTAGGAEPPAPARLIVRPFAGGLRLSWEPVRIPGDVRYRVLRKQGSVPWDEGDGEMIASTADAQADDTSLTPGVPWYYAVFTLRSGLASTVPAHSGPHVVSEGAAAPVPSRRLGGLPVRRVAAAAALLLALGCGGAAVFYWPAPAKLLASLLPAAKSQSPQKFPATPNPGSPGGPGTGGQAGSQNVPPPNPNQVIQVNPNPGPQQMAAVPLPPVTPPQPDMNPGQIIGSSGQGGQTGHVLGQQSSRPAPPVMPVPPRPAAALPQIPEVTVLAVGDPLLATAVEDELEQAFRSEGFTVASGLASLDGFRQDRADKPSVSQVFSALQGDGVHVLVLARVDLLAERELSYYGRKDVASTSRLRIDAYLMDGRRSLDNWSDQIEYTAVNAATEGEAAARRAASSLSSAIHGGWSAHRNAGSTP